jgi:hypothetical protein
MGLENVTKGHTGVGVGGVKSVTYYLKIPYTKSFSGSTENKKLVEATYPFWDKAKLIILTE